jgi:hypothetical protein
VILWAMILGVSAADRIMCNVFMFSATGSALEACSYEYNKIVDPPASSPALAGRARALPARLFCVTPPNS